jgi:outer membrane protein assembly factor BamB
MIFRKPYLLIFLLTHTIHCFGQHDTNKTSQVAPAPKRLFDLIYLAQVASLNGEYPLALEHLDKLMADYPDTIVANFKLEDGWTYGLNKGPLHALCMFRKAEIYRTLKQNEKAFEFYNEIVRRYTDERMSRNQSEGIGWNMPVALQAVHKMADMSESKELSRSILLDQYNIAYQNAGNGLTKVFAANLYAKLLGDEGKTEEALAVLKDVILNYSDQRIFTYKDQVSYSASAVSLVYDIVFIVGRNERLAIDELENIFRAKKDSDKTVGLVAKYFTAKTQENSALPSDTVTQSYKEFLENAPKDLQVTFQNGAGNLEVLRYHDIKSRYETISTYWKRKAVVKNKDTKLFARADSTSATIADLYNGDLVTLQYQGQNASSWYKVMDEKGRTGWLTINKIHVTENPFLFKKEKYSNWPLFDKNNKIQRHISGKPILHPVIRQALENVVSGRVAFFDVTHDNIPEIFAGEIDPLTKGIYMTCREGTQPKTLWRTKVSACIIGKNGFVRDSILYIGCQSINAYSGEIVKTEKNDYASDEFATRLAGLKKFQGRYELTYQDTSKIIAFSSNGKEQYDMSLRNLVTDKKEWTTIVSPCDFVVHKEITADKLVIITRSDRAVPKLYFKTFDITTGTLLKTSLITNQLTYLFYANPIRVKDKILLAAKDSLHVYNFPDGNFRWKARGEVNSAALVGNTLYCISGTLSESGSVYAYNFETGKLLWKFDMGRITATISTAGPVLAINTGSTVYFIGDESNNIRKSTKGRK